MSKKAEKVFKALLTKEQLAAAKVKGHEITMDYLKAQFKELYEMLEEVVNHADWCGWGDKYERECAFESNLPKRASDVLEKMKGLVQ